MSAKETVVLNRFYGVFFFLRFKLQIKNNKVQGCGLSGEGVMSRKTCNLFLLNNFVLFPEVHSGSFSSEELNPSKFKVFFGIGDEQKLYPLLSGFCC
ncbi:hypothetical protein F0562_013589 [Nyssa sinensis]|uniref:Uncharacterized protein n=1 Tax=Nyssa sinensis TaxID=561372 RepID=A0A5J4ZPB9_9ASTE|nr:hypothetical protein F0562_013589 [Nyssa sinensis]